MPSKGFLNKLGGGTGGPSSKSKNKNKGQMKPSDSVGVEMKTDKAGASPAVLKKDMEVKEEGAAVSNDVPIVPVEAPIEELQPEQDEPPSRFGRLKIDEFFNHPNTTTEHLRSWDMDEEDDEAFNEACIAAWNATTFRTKSKEPQPQQDSSEEVDPNDRSQDEPATDGIGQLSHGAILQQFPAHHNLLDPDVAAESRRLRLQGRISPSRNILLSHKFRNRGLKGLVNIGNTCFMNSIIQCLSNTRPLIEYINKNEFVKDIVKVPPPASSRKGKARGSSSTAQGPSSKFHTQKPGALVQSFANIIQKIWADPKAGGGEGPVDASEFKSYLQEYAPVFRGYKQHDAQELLRILLEGLHNDIDRRAGKEKIKPNPPKPNDPPGIKELSREEESQNAWREYLMTENSEIVDIFAGQLRSTLKCKTCGNESVNFEPFWDLSLQIPEPLRKTKAQGGCTPIDLEECLYEFTKEEILEGNNKPFCTKCNAKTKASKRLTIERFPDILCLHLKKFSSDGTAQKLDVPINIPQFSLELGTYSYEPTCGLGYNLYAVSHHSGSVDYGHYVAFCRQPYTSHWFRFDDTMVTEVNHPKVAFTDGYVLFYELSLASRSMARPSFNERDPSLPAPDLVPAMSFYDW